MAITIPAPSGQANPTRAELTTIHAAHVERIDAAAEKTKWGRNPDAARPRRPIFQRLRAAGLMAAAWHARKESGKAYANGPLANPAAADCGLPGASGSGNLLI
jgi:hypothetical protein